MHPKELNHNKIIACWAEGGVLGGNRAPGPALQQAGAITPELRLTTPEQRRTRLEVLQQPRLLRRKANNHKRRQIKNYLGSEQSLKFRRIIAQQTQVTLRLSWGFVPWLKLVQILN